jgi:hypothetical protein
MTACNPAGEAIDTALQLLNEALLIADRAVISDIETECVVEVLHWQRWYDTRPMLDPRERPDDLIEMARQAIEYAVRRGLVERHHAHAYLVRVL